MLQQTYSTYNITKPNKKCKSIRSISSQIFFYFVSFLLVAIIILLIANPIKYMASINAGIKLFFYSVFPSLLPFLFISKILTSMGIFDKLSKPLGKPIYKLFGTPPITAYVFLMSILCGYPIGAKLIGEIYENEQITTKEAKSMFALSTTSGPIFVIGAVGASMLSDAKLGLHIYICHIISSLLCGLVFRNRNKNENTKSKIKKFNDTEKILEKSIYSTIISILTIAIYVSIFYMVIDMAYDVKILGFSKNLIEQILRIIKIDTSSASGLASGSIEMTRGLYELSFVGNNKIKFIFCSALISFSGLSIILQSLTFLSKTKINALYVVFVKSIQFVITIIVSIFYAKIFI